MRAGRLFCPETGAMRRRRHGNRQSWKQDGRDDRGGTGGEERLCGGYAGSNEGEGDCCGAKVVQNWPNFAADTGKQGVQWVRSGKAPLGAGIAGVIHSARSGPGGTIPDSSVPRPNWHRPSPAKGCFLVTSAVHRGTSCSAEDRSYGAVSGGSEGGAVSRRRGVAAGDDGECVREGRRRRSRGRTYSASRTSSLHVVPSRLL